MDGQRHLSEGQTLRLRTASIATSCLPADLLNTNRKFCCFQSDLHSRFGQVKNQVADDAARQQCSSAHNFSCSQLARCTDSSTGDQKKAGGGSIGAAHDGHGGTSSIRQNQNEQQEDPTAMVASMGAGQESSMEGSSMMSSSLAHDEAGIDWQVSLGGHSSGYTLGWSVDHSKNEVLFTLKINTSRAKFRPGYDIFGLGFSDYGQLDGADFCLLWFDLAHSARMRDARIGGSPAGRLRVLDRADSYCKLLVVPSADSGNARGWQLEAEGEGEAEDSGAQLLAFRFSRPLDTCRDDYYTIDNGTTHLIWFKMDGPLLEIDGINLKELQQEASRGNGTSSANRRSFESGLSRVQLAAPAAAAASKASPGLGGSRASGMMIDVRLDQYEIPPRETTYWCKLFKLPHRFRQRKFHITKYEAIIDEGNEHIVHHMELFNCVYESAEQEQELRALYESGGGWSGECQARSRPRAIEICRRVILAWAMGAKPLEYPNEVGQSIGGHHYSPFVMLEVHYNNVRSLGGQRDSSGLRFHYTHKLRAFDAGIMEVGLEYTAKNSIPPNVIAPLVGYCVSECTRVAMGSSPSMAAATAAAAPASPETIEMSGGDTEMRAATSGEARRQQQQQQHQREQHLKQKPEGIYIFAAQMHTHLAGVASWTEHVREGRLMGELQRDSHYSPHFQEIRLLPEPVHLAPGDSLIHYCLYDTRERANITLGGFATSDEMCVTYLHYYPRIELEVCKSSVDSRALGEYFAHMSREQSSSKKKKSQPNLNQSNKSNVEAATTTTKQRPESVSEKYQSIEWSRRTSRELMQFYASAPLSVQCNRSNGDRFPGFWNGVTPTRVYWSPASQKSENSDRDEDDDDDADDGGGGGGGPTRRFASVGAAGHWGPRVMQYRGLAGEKAARTARSAERCALAAAQKGQAAV